MALQISVNQAKPSVPMVYKPVSTLMTNAVSKSPIAEPDADASGISGSVDTTKLIVGGVLAALFVGTILLVQSHTRGGFVSNSARLPRSGIRCPMCGEGKIYPIDDTMFACTWCGDKYHKDRSMPEDGSWGPYIRGAIRGLPAADRHPSWDKVDRRGPPPAPPPEPPPPEPGSLEAMWLAELDWAADLELYDSKGVRLLDRPRRKASIQAYYDYADAKRGRGRVKNPRELLERHEALLEELRRRNR